MIDLDETELWRYKTAAYTFYDVCGDTEEMHQLSYFSKPGFTYWIISRVIEVVPLAGPYLARAFRNAVYHAANQ